MERSHTPALIGQLRGDANLIGWWAFRDLNPEPSAYEADALTIVLKAHVPGVVKVLQSFAADCSLSPAMPSFRLCRFVC